jgi:antitoxin component YwqK of YwqJK toxin-antitoxin module
MVRFVNVHFKPTKLKVILFILFLSTLSVSAISQWKDYRLINDGKDTINRIDQNDRKQGEWVVRIESLRGEPGFEEEGVFVNNRKEGEWRVFNLMGDLIGIEHYRWGLKDGIAQYFNINGQLRLEQSWKALNPDKAYDTIQVEDVDKLNSFREVVVKNEGASLKHGTWKYYDTEGGAILRSETYTLGKLETDNSTANAEPTTPKKVAKPKEVLEFEKTKGKKKIRYQDGSTM